MSERRVMMAAVLLLILAPPLRARADGEAPSPASLHGRHAVSVRVGLIDHSSIEATSGVSGSTARVSGFAGYLSYDYGIAPEWALGVSAGALDAETLSSATVGSVVSSVASVTPVLVEARWYPMALAMGASGRPFLGVGVGPYLGSATNAIVGSAGSSGTVTETVVGGRAQAGIDWIVGRRVLLEVAGGYHAVGEFDQPIGSETKYSGAEFLVGIGLLFGSPR